MTEVVAEEEGLVAVLIAQDSFRDPALGYKKDQFLAAQEQKKLVPNSYSWNKMVMNDKS